MADAGIQSQRSSRSGTVSRWLRLGLVTFASLMLIPIMSNAQWTPWRIAGACLIVFGLGMWIIAQFQLGNSFSVTPQARVLVTRGVYSRIRNPIYVFSAIFIVGVALFIEKPWLAATLLVIIPLQAFRARREARVLEDRFGEEYREYRRKTWF